jgi:hypothetical protein
MTITTPVASSDQCRARMHHKHDGSLEAVVATMYQTGAAAEDTGAARTAHVTSPAARVDNMVADERLPACNCPCYGPLGSRVP